MTNVRFAVFSPSDPSLSEFPKRLERAGRAFARYGIDLVVPDGSLHRSSYLAGDARHRAGELNRLAADPNIDGVIAALGGHNSNGLLPHLDYALFAERRLPVIGNSDVSALLVALWAVSWIESYLGPAVLPEWGELPDVQRYDVDGLLAALSGRAFRIGPSTSWTGRRGDWANDMQGSLRPRDRPTRWRVLREGRGVGTLFGGNLETLNMLVGTPYWQPPDNALVCLEATGTEAHLPRLERALTHLRQSGLFDRAIGILFGRMPDATPVAGETLDSMISRVLGDYAIPIVLDIDIGHSSPMATLPIGRTAEILCLDDAVLLDLAATVRPTTPPIAKGSHPCMSPAK